MFDRTCAIDGCEQATRTKSADWCGTHYFRWYRNGDPLVLIRPAPTATCDLPDCTRSTRKGHRICSMHRARFSRHSDLAAVNTLKRGKTATYRTAHSWVFKDRGCATEHRCQHCSAAAENWAYDHCDPKPEVSPAGRQYSLNTTRYLPLCKRCHGAFDAAWRREHRQTIWV